MKKKQMSKSEIKEFNNSIVNFNFEIDRKDRVELVEDDGLKLLIVNNVPYFFFYENHLVPTLKLLSQKLLLKRIVVDMGAVKFVTKGADIMRPGIKSIDPAVNKGDFVVVVDEQHNKPLAVGVCLFSHDELLSMSSGKGVKTIHFVGDSIWKFE